MFNCKDIDDSIMYVFMIILIFQDVSKDIPASVLKRWSTKRYNAIMPQGRDFDASDSRSQRRWYSRLF